MKETISYENFAKLDLRPAIIEKVEDIKGADKLYKLSLDLAGEKRTIWEVQKKSEANNINRCICCVVYCSGDYAHDEFWRGGEKFKK